MLPLALLFVVPAAVQAGPPPVLVHEGAAQWLDGHVEFVLDPQGLETPQDLEHRHPDGFEPVGPHSYTQGTGAYGVPAWLRMEIANPLARRADLLLEVDNVLLDHVEAWVARGSAWAGPWPGGESADPATRIVPHSYPRFPVVLDPGERAVVYLRIQDEGTVAVPLLLGTATQLDQRWVTRQIVGSPGTELEFAL